MGIPDPAPSPAVVATRRGPVECAVFGAGPAVLAIDGGGRVSIFTHRNEVRAWTEPGTA